MVGVRDVELVAGRAITVDLRVTVVAGAALLVAGGAGETLLGGAVISVVGLADGRDPELFAIAAAVTGTAHAMAAAMTTVRPGCARTQCRA